MFGWVPLPDLEVAELSEDALDPGDDVVHEPARDPLVHGRLLLGGRLYVEELDQWFDCDALTNKFELVCKFN